MIVEAGAPTTDLAPTTNGHLSEHTRNPSTTARSGGGRCGWDHRGGELRLLPRPGRPLLPRRRPRALIPGLMHTVLGGYHGDIEFSAAFDVDPARWGRPGPGHLGRPNNTIKFADVPHLGVPVHRGGPTTDGLGHYGHTRIEQSETPPTDVARILADTGTDVIVNYLPVGSEEATRWYMEQALAAGTAWSTASPSLSPARRSGAPAPAGLPIVGDDIKSQVGPPSCTAPWPASSATGGQAGAHQPAQRGREHGLLQHAGALPPGEQEGLQDQRRDQPGRP